MNTPDANFSGVYAHREGFAFSERTGGTVTVHNGFASREAAEVALAGRTTPAVYPTDDQDRKLNEIMVNHINARIAMQPSGAMVVTTDDGEDERPTVYVIDRDGEVVA